MEALTPDDLDAIVASLHPTIPPQMRSRLISFNAHIQHDTMTACAYGRKGSPWDFNLRDVFRWCELLERHHRPGDYRPAAFVDTIYSLVRTTYNIYLCEN